MIDRLIYAVTALALLSVLVFDETFAANVARDLGEEAAIMLDPWVAGIGGVFVGLLAAALYRECPMKTWHAVAFLIVTAIGAGRGARRAAFFSGLSMSTQAKITHR